MALLAYPNRELIQDLIDYNNPLKEKILRDYAKKYGCTTQRVSERFKKARRIVGWIQDFGNVELGLNLPVRILGSFSRNNITYEKLKTMDDKQILRINNIGEHFLQIIKEAVNSYEQSRQGKEN